MTALTPDELTEHRLKELEATAVAAHATERAVDHLSLAVGRFEGMLLEVRTEARKNDDHTRGSLAALHRRLDDLAADEQREQGAKAERARFRGWVFAAVGAGTAFAGVVIGVLTLVLK